MKIEDVQKNAKERKTVPISIRTYPSYSKFMRDNSISPSALFNKAVEEIISKDK